MGQLQKIDLLTFFIANSNDEPDMAATNATLMEEYYYACRNGDLNTVQKCIEEGVDINGLDDGYSPFGCACELNHQQIVEYLIEKNVEVAHLGKNGYTTLMFASRYGHTKIAELLLMQNSSTDFIRHGNKWNQTALMWAVYEGHENVVKLLLFYDPSEEHIMIGDYKGKTASDWAKTDTIKELLKSPPTVQTKRAKQFFFSE